MLFFFDFVRNLWKKKKRETHRQHIKEHLKKKNGNRRRKKKEKEKQKSDLPLLSYPQ